MLRAGGNLKHLAAAKCRHFNRRSEGRLGEADGHLANDVIVMPSEHRVRLDCDVAVEIARRGPVFTGLTFAGNSHGLSLVHPRRNLDRHNALAKLTPTAPARLAMLANDRPTAPTIGARGDHAENAAEALLGNASLAAALDADGRRNAGLCTAAFAGFAEFLALELERLLAGCRDFLKGKLDLRLEIEAALRASSRPLSTSSSSA